MFGHGCLPGVVDLGAADFPGVVGVGVVGVVDVDAAGTFDPLLVVGVAVDVVGAAAAPAMPAAAPPVASAPATIVAPSIFEMRMR
jgi:hypothetical protein